MLTRQPLKFHAVPPRKRLSIKESAADVAEAFRGAWRDPLAINLPPGDRPMALAHTALLAVMLYVAALALFGHFVLTRMAEGMDGSLATSLTVEILPATAAQKNWASADDRAREATGRLRAIPGVTSVTPVPAARMVELLKPWIGDKAALADLPMPQLLDVQLQRGAIVDHSALEKALEPVPGTAIDDHGRFLQDLKGFSASLRHLAFYITLLAFGALLLSAFFAAAASFQINRDMIELLHLMGAQDNAIAQHSGMATLRLAAIASAAALGLALLTLIALSASSSGIDLSLLPSLDFGFSDWLLLALQWLLLFLFAPACCLLAARFTVLASLRRLL
jgi:cell division transport system permease protein